MDAALLVYSKNSLLEKDEPSQPSNVNGRPLPFIFAKAGNTKETTLNITEWVVTVARPNFVSHRTDWFNYLLLRPEVAVCVEEERVFKTYPEAREYVKTWWANQK